MNNRLVLAAFALLNVSCAPMPLLPLAPPEPVHVVLTFDDGPLPADLRLDKVATPEALQTPLTTILEKLHRRDAKALFFVCAPGMTDAPDEFLPAFAGGLSVIYDAGHLLGYHAYAHDAQVWANPALSFGEAQARMSADLDALTAYIDRSLAAGSRTRDALFSHVMRQPFGGYGLFAIEALPLAAQRGWAFRGFRIDAVDWTDNLTADPGFAASLPFASESQRVAYSRGRLRQGASLNLWVDKVDVLLHVNHFTADHLDEWLDELRDAYAALGRPVIFDVPENYIQESDPFVDELPVTAEAVVRGLLGMTTDGPPGVVR